MKDAKANTPKNQGEAKPVLSPSNARNPQAGAAPAFKPAPSRHAKISGRSISPGMAMGRAYVFKPAHEFEKHLSVISPSRVGHECQRIESAVKDVLLDLRHSIERIEESMGSAMADIFRAHELMLKGDSLKDEVCLEVKNHQVNAECALERVFGLWKARFRGMEEAHFQQRSDDMDDLLSRLLRSLAGVHTHSLEQMPGGSILVAHRLLPSDATLFTPRSIEGIALEVAGSNSHCALLTRQLGLPGIGQAEGLLERIKTGDFLLLDALNGTVTVAPDLETRLEFTQQMEQYQDKRCWARQRSHLRALTRSGVPVEVMANVGNRHDAEVAAKNGADGIGLFRMEVLFLSKTMLPTEEELIDEIGDAIAPFRKKPVIVRLLDIGGDKNLPYLPHARETHPFLGKRGVRLLLENPSLLEVQLRALVRLFQNQEIRILIPMVTVPEDVRQVRIILQRVADELGSQVLPQLCSMVETPAAALCAAEIAAESDFLNIGTNDLTQYTMAAGREDPEVSEYFDDQNAAVFKLLANVGRQAEHLPVGSCGELAARADAVPELLKAGIRMLSVPPSLVPEIKDAVRES
ncbi:MAG: phosphoenolpyruvate--protein phosphotransferase [Opitutales bacterium]